MATCPMCQAPLDACNGSSELLPLNEQEDFDSGPNCGNECRKGKTYKKKKVGPYQSEFCCSCKKALQKNRALVWEYPTCYENFNWFQDSVRELKLGQNAAKTREESTRKSHTEAYLPIRPRGPNRYPYRYTSAEPSVCGRTAQQWDIRRALMRLQPVSGNIKFDVAESVKQIKGYETESMTASLQPFVAMANPSKEPPIGSNKTLIEPLFLPYTAHSDFESWVINELHPTWRDDPLYRRRLLFHSRPTFKRPNI